MCSYYQDTCSALDVAFPDGQCPPLVTQCRCPFKQNKLQIRGLEVELPQLPPELAPIVPVSYMTDLLLNTTKHACWILGIPGRMACLYLNVEMGEEKVHEGVRPALFLKASYTIIE